MKTKRIVEGGITLAIAITVYVFVGTVAAESWNATDDFMASWADPGDLYPSYNPNYPWFYLDGAGNLLIPDGPFLWSGQTGWGTGSRDDDFYKLFRPGLEGHDAGITGHGPSWIRFVVPAGISRTTLYISGVIQQADWEPSRAMQMKINGTAVVTATPDYLHHTFDDFLIHDVSTGDVVEIKLDGSGPDPTPTFSAWDVTIRTANARPTAVAGTSLDGNNRLQLDGTLSSDPDGDPLTFSWQIEGETTHRTGQIVSIADLPVGNYQVILTVGDGTYTETDTMLFGVPAGAGVEPPPADALQEQVQNIKDRISCFSTSSFDAPNEKAAENRRKALLNMLDKVSEHIDTGDFQAAIDQLEDILVKSDRLSPPDSPPDWIIDDPVTTEINEQEEIAQSLSNLLIDLDALL